MPAPLDILKYRLSNSAATLAQLEVAPDTLISQDRVPAEMARSVFKGQVEKFMGENRERPDLDVDFQKELAKLDSEIAEDAQSQLQKSAAEFAGKSDNTSVENKPPRDIPPASASGTEASEAWDVDDENVVFIRDGITAVDLSPEAGESGKTTIDQQIDLNDLYL